jgi:hypothetical protein
LGTVYGPIEVGVEFDSISVYPSAGARATSLPPSVPPAPGLLSTITGWPSALASGSEIARATMSLAPPAAKVTTMRIGFSGHAARALAHSDSASRTRMAIRRWGMAGSWRGWGPGRRKQ